MAQVTPVSFGGWILYDENSEQDPMSDIIQALRQVIEQVRKHKCGPPRKIEPVWIMPRRSWDELRRVRKKHGDGAALCALWRLGGYFVGWFPVEEKHDQYLEEA